MPLHNDNRLYSGGAVTFNTQPSVNFYANLLARKAAREDALDEYYRKLPSTINDAGMRDQERPELNKRVNDIMEYSIKNKEALRNPRSDNGKAQYELEKMYRDAHGFVNTSKDLAKTDLEIGKKRLEGNSPWLFDDDEMINTLAAHHLPLNDPNHRSIDLATLDVPPKPYGAKEIGEDWKVAVGEMKARKTQDEANARKDATTGTVIIPYKEVYEPNQVKQIAENFGNIVSGDKGKQRQFLKMAEDKPTYDSYNKAFKSVYGIDKDISSATDMAKAHAIIKAQVPIGQGEDRIADTGLAFRRQQMLENIKQANRKEMLRLHEKAKALGAAAEDIWIDSYIDKLTEEAKTGEKGLFGAGKQGYEVAIDPTLAKALTRDGKSPDKLVVTEDGKYVPIFYKYDSKGNLIPKEKGSVIPAVSETLSVPITKEQLKLAMGGRAGVKQLNKEMGASEPEKNEYIYNGKKFTKEQIEKAAKQNNMSVEDYIKKAGIK